MLADARAPAVLAPFPLAVMLADARAPAVLAGAPLAVMVADARAPAVLAAAPAAVMLADARAPAVLAVARAAVMLADARAPAVLALTPAAVVFALLLHPPRCAPRAPLPLPPSLLRGLAGCFLLLSFPPGRPLPGAFATRARGHVAAGLALRLPVPAASLAPRGCAAQRPPLLPCDARLRQHHPPPRPRRGPRQGACKGHHRRLRALRARARPRAAGGRAGAVEGAAGAAGAAEGGRGRAAH